ncbi:hypothetical protein [uncultured Thiohalocapsa sp.]|uniref:hypothetical protein n=1 Tax=uncultured Thiohalocapsa sp. TaxID=768990 RepID=UPI0025F748EA|nr:hypothetical protein [uncultured Thiohalocapsa sp.]
MLVWSHGRVDQGFVSVVLWHEDFEAIVTPDEFVVLLSHEAVEDGPGSFALGLIRCVVAHRVPCLDEGIELLLSSNDSFAAEGFRAEGIPHSLAAAKIP